MNLIFEDYNNTNSYNVLPKLDVEDIDVSDGMSRKKDLKIPQLSEIDISRHYTKLASRVHGLNNGFYPLGSCTMKYNPKINEEIAGLVGFTNIHPLQPAHTIQGCLEVFALAEEYLCNITGMDNVSLQPAAGAHGEFTGLLMIRAYHKSRGDLKRNKIIVPDSAHGTNPASASMAGFDVVCVPSGKDGCVDIDKLRDVLGEDTAGLMLTNPNTVGIFEKDILAITELVHESGGLVYYDGANLNAIMGIARPGDMGFDVVHLNLHKTFSTPHGGGGPGSGPVGCKQFLSKFLPNPRVVREHDVYKLQENPYSIGMVKSFYGNFLVVVKALTYMLSIGREGIKEVAQNAVLNANYMKKELSEYFDMAFDGFCMHEFVMTLENLKKEKNVSAMDIAKSLLDNEIHPPTMYFPLIVHEALMIEPTETESKKTMDEAIAILKEIYKTALSNPEQLHKSPEHTPVRRLDEVLAARKPKLRA